MSRIRWIMRSRAARRVAVLVAALAAASVSVLPGGAAAAPNGAADNSTATPMKHVVIIVGENHSFDNVFATYRPPAGQHVENLLSEGIVTPSGGAGPNATRADVRVQRGGRGRPTAPLLPDVPGGLGR